jgi:hypothetical protein
MKLMRSSVLALTCAVAACSDSPLDLDFGWLDITVTTTTGTDPNGYTITVILPGPTPAEDDEQGIYPVAVNASLSIQRPVGHYRLVVTGLATGCEVQGGPTLNVEIVSSERTTAAITVACP